MTNKDYSHIKQGMYVLISELGDRGNEVLDAFGKAEGVERVCPDFLDTEDFLGFDRNSSVDTYDNVGCFGHNNQQVSVDFILNGPKKEEDDDVKFKVGEVYQCGDVKVKIIYIIESYGGVVGVELSEEGKELDYVGLWDSRTGGYNVHNYEDFCYGLKPIKDNTETLKEIEELKERIKQLEEGL